MPKSLKTLKNLILDGHHEKSEIGILMNTISEFRLMIQRDNDYFEDWYNNILDKNKTYEYQYFNIEDGSSGTELRGYQISKKEDMFLFFLEEVDLIFNPLHLLLVNIYNEKV